MALPAHDFPDPDVVMPPGSADVTSGARRRRVPHARLPAGRDNWRTGGVISLLVHLAVLLLLFAPLTMTGELEHIAQGAGGPGAAGGGGGSTGGEGLEREALHFVRVAPPAPQPAVVAPKVVVPPPKPEPQPKMAPVMPSPTTAADTTATAAPNNGGQEAGGGSGPGSGGGVGSGTGTGVGSANGPGSGGGTQADYPPTPDVMFIPPLPTPSSVKGFHLRVQFDVDSNGRVIKFTFTPTPDGGYNRKLQDVFKGFRFRPGTHPDGTPIRMIAELEYIL